jgi:hypothetical protein
MSETFITGFSLDILTNNIVMICFDFSEEKEESGTTSGQCTSASSSSCADFNAEQDELKAPLGKNKTPRLRVYEGTLKSHTLLRD